VSKLKDVELMIRVKLPRGGCWEGISGGCNDADHHKAAKWRLAIFAAKPSGYEVKWPAMGERWPKDSEGYVWVPLYLTHAKDAAAHWAGEYMRIYERLTALRKQIQELRID
jgi:hypothetical protein